MYIISWTNINLTGIREHTQTGALCDKKTVTKHHKQSSEDRLQPSTQVAKLKQMLLSAH